MNLRSLKYVIIVSLVFIVSCSDSRQVPFSFVQLCDTQLGMGGYAHDVRSFNLAVSQINALEPDFVVICGDLVHHAADSTYDDFLNIKAALNVPCYVLPGNHDVGNIPNDTTLGYYRERVGEDYYEFQHKGYSFILTNTQLWKVDVKNESEKHDRWFKETLQAQSMNQRPVFVIGHSPLYVEQPDEEEQYFNLPLVKRLELLELFTRNNVKAYLSGHKHTTLVNNYQNIQLVTGETTSKNFDERPLGFRRWDVSSDTIIHHFIALQPSPENPVQTEGN